MFNNIINNLKDKINNLKESYVLKKPNNIYEIKEQKLDMLIDKLNTNINKIIELNKVRLFKYKESYVLNNPEVLYKFKKQNLDNIISKLQVLNPLNTLKRGYSITKLDNKVISSIKNIKKDNLLTIKVKDGIIDTKVVKVSEENG